MIAAFLRAMHGLGDLPRRSADGRAVACVETIARLPARIGVVAPPYGVGAEIAGSVAAQRGRCVVVRCLLHEIGLPAPLNDCAGDADYTGTAVADGVFCHDFCSS